ncbi:hypothetical protein DH26_gp091 [Chloriridovirus anopheles1]|uniref:Uncharacterized protein n=1 Tax=Chloriridovirus anopheles1 TaxID=1465751 RepID=W8QF41_9VIRU|nr:hypothetical protein DH26_gp091 [Anopheles minimus iridovirus]AHL67584.1 hypothetical protein AMIV_091 [Anopheles minimus iridovirus]
MNQASFFIEKKALFGGYPTHEQIIELQKCGVTTFVDLTFGAKESNLKVYSHLVDKWINYPIKDGNVPQNNKNFLIFLLLVQMIVESLKPGEKIYIHCRGGHGRSTLVVACFLGMVFQLSYDKSLNLAKMYHDMRPNLSPRWYVADWPLNVRQRHFVESFFGQLYLHSNVTLTELNCQIDILRYFVIVNFHLHQNPFLLQTLLHSGCKTILGEGVLSGILQQLRGFMLQNIAKKIFDQLMII